MIDQQRRAIALLPWAWPVAAPIVAVGGLAAGEAVRAQPGAGVAAADADLRQAFAAFYPLYEMSRLRWMAVGDGAPFLRRQTVNRIVHLRKLSDHTARAVTTPNSDTLYSSAWLDLGRGPVVVETPAIAGRYYSLQFMNAYTDNVAILGRRVGGDGPLRVVVAGPDTPAADLPSHTHLVRSDTPEMWLLGRVLAVDAADIAAANAVQDGITLRAPSGSFAAPQLGPLRDVTPARFVDVVAEALARNPPQGALREVAAAAAAVGLRPSTAPLFDGLPEPLRARWTAAWPALVAELRVDLRAQAAAAGGAAPPQVDGWLYPPPALGRYGDDRWLRSRVALAGIGALDIDEALYLDGSADAEGALLDGSRRYRLRIPPGGVPARAFWSVTVYEPEEGGRWFLVDNPLNRYSIGDRTPGARRNDDGSTDWLLQAEPPADRANWLPVPRGRFKLQLRAYLPEPDLVAGRARLPRIERV